MTPDEIETGSKVIDLMAALKESLSPGAPEKAAEVIEGVATKCDVRPDPIPEGAFETLPDVYITGDGAIIEVPPATFVDVSQIVIDADETRFIESGPATKGWW